MSTKFGLQNHFDYAVVGGGVMGVSAALALRRGSPSAKIIIFEGDEMKTASKGICKIIRTPYIDKNYILLAEEAKKRWESELPYCNFYRRTGWIQEVRGDNYVPFHPGERLIKVEDLSRMVRSRIPPQLDTGTELWLNKDIGVADAARALEVTAVEAATHGVIRQKMNISKLIIDNGICRGVERTDGTIVTAETTILATGPWTPALLESSTV